MERQRKRTLKRKSSREFGMHEGMTRVGWEKTRKMLKVGFLGAVGIKADKYMQK